MNVTIHITPWNEIYLAPIEGVTTESTVLLPEDLGEQISTVLQRWESNDESTSELQDQCQADWDELCRLSEVVSTYL